ncbi:glycosyltransferase family 9 protein [Candidatus Woesearchaeota archaeon]|nr:glycosyltransferase family 9 protein [Candidatus Woesearchaeota archaeon]
MKKILVFSLPGIGNTLMITPMLEALRVHYKDAKITVIVMYKSCKEILEGNLNVDEVILFEFIKQGYIKSLKFLYKLSKEKFDISIMPHPSNELYYTLVSFFSRAKIKIGHRYPYFSMNLSYKYPYFKITSLSFLYNKTISLGSKHEVDENLDLIKLLGINPVKVKKKFFLTLEKSNSEFVLKFLKDNKINGLKIGIHPGASKYAGMQNKRWPKDKYIELCDYLIENYKANILIFGGDDENDLKQSIRQNVKNRNNVFLVSTQSIKDAAAVIGKCDFFITNDTGLMHIAATLDVLTIAISGAVDYRRTHPLNKKSAVVYHDISCYPCYRFGENLECKRKEKDYACLKYISIYNVVMLLEKLKNGSKGPIIEKV